MSRIQIQRRWPRCYRMIDSAEIKILYFLGHCFYHFTKFLISYLWRKCPLTKYANFDFPSCDWGTESNISFLPFNYEKKIRFEISYGRKSNISSWTKGTKIMIIYWKNSVYDHYFIVLMWEKSGAWRLVFVVIFVRDCAENRSKSPKWTASSCAAESIEKNTDSNSRI